MINHKIYKGKNKFNPKNKILILVIRKQPGEVDWILPILHNVRKKINIIVIFEKNIALKLLKENYELYYYFLKSINYYLSSSKLKCLGLRLLKKTFGYFNLRKFEKKIQNKIYEKYYSLDNLKKIISCEEKNIEFKNVKILCQDFTDNSPWIKKFYEKNDNTKIINYPHTTNIFNINKYKLKPSNVKFKRIFTLLSSKRDLSYFSKKFQNTNIYISGYPKYDLSWLTKISKNCNIKKYYSDKNIFIAFKGFENFKYSKSKYVEQVKSLFEIAQKNSYKLIFKFHPNAQEEPVFLNIANRYPKDMWSITKKHIHICSKISKVFISFYSNAAVLDSLASEKVPVELWNISKKKKLFSNYSKLNLCIQVKNKIDLEDKIEKIINNKYEYIKKKEIIKNFIKIINTKSSLSKLSDFFIKISQN